jgi:hypothetical protein
MKAEPTPLPPGARLQRDPLAVIAVPLAPIVLEGRYRLLVGALWRLRRSRKGQWALAAGSGALVIALALLTARHFATTSWPLASGNPGLLVAAGLLLLFDQAFKAYGWGRLFTSGERPQVLALAAGNGGAALMGVVLPGRFDDAMRVAVVRRYPGLSCRCACALSLPRDARPGRQRRPGAARFGCHRVFGRRDRRAGWARRGRRRRSRGCRIDPRVASSGRE